MHKWKKEEDELLKSAYTKYPIKKIAERLRRSYNSVLHRANRLGLKVPKEVWNKRISKAKLGKSRPLHTIKKMSETRKRLFKQGKLTPYNRIDLPEEKIKELYLTKKLSTIQIGKIFGVSNDLIRKRLKKLKIPRRTQFEAHMVGKKLPTRAMLVKLHWKDGLRVYQIAKKLGFHQSTMYRIFKHYKIRIKRWKSFYGKHHTPDALARMFKNRNARPNIAERKLALLLKDFPVRYTGDGQQYVGGRCPDFTFTDGSKRVIELFGRYWHDPSINPKVRFSATENATIDHYQKHGFECLIVWDDELENERKLFKKIEAWSSFRNLFKHEFSNE